MSSRGSGDETHLNVPSAMMAGNDDGRKSSSASATNNNKSLSSIVQGLGTSKFAPILSCLGYSACSMGMVLTNKLVLSKFQFHSTFFLLAFQSACSVALVYGGKRLKFLTFEEFRLDVASKWLPVNLLFCAMLYTGFKSLDALAVPLVTIFKNLTNIVILFGDWYFFGQTASCGVVSSLGIIVVGAIFAGYSDISFSLSGYTWMFLNCCATASYVLYLRAAISSTKLSKFGMAFYNNLLSVPITLFCSMFAGETATVVAFPLWGSGYFEAGMVLGGSLGFCLNLASLWCIQTTSPSTYSMVGSLNKIPLAFLGIILFNEPVTVQLAIFITLALCGGILYSYLKDQEMQRKKEAAKLELPTQAVPGKMAK